MRGGGGLGVWELVSSVSFMKEEQRDTMSEHYAHIEDMARRILYTGFCFWSFGEFGAQCFLVLCPFVRKTHSCLRPGEKTG